MGLIFVFSRAVIGEPEGASIEDAHAVVFAPGELAPGRQLLARSGKRTATREARMSLLRTEPGNTLRMRCGEMSRTAILSSDSLRTVSRMSSRCGFLRNVFRMLLFKSTMDG